MHFLSVKILLICFIDQLVVVDLSGQVAFIKEKLMAEIPGHIAKNVKLQGNVSRIRGGEGYISSDIGMAAAIPPAATPLL